MLGTGEQETAERAARFREQDRMRRLEEAEAGLRTREEHGHCLDEDVAALKAEVSALKTEIADMKASLAGVWSRLPG